MKVLQNTYTFLIVLLVDLFDQTKHADLEINYLYIFFYIA